MVYRKRSTRRMPKKYSKLPRGRRTTRGALMSLRGKVPTYHFKRMSDTGSIVLGSNQNAESQYGYVSNGLSFRLSQGSGSVDNNMGVHTPADFTGLFDRYRINKVVVRFKWSLDFSTGVIPPDNLLTNCPILYLKRDNDDRSPPTYDVMKQSADCKQVILSPNKFVAISVRPSTVIDAGSGGSNVIKWKQWIDMADPSKDHYGIKFGVLYPGLTAYGRLNYQAIIYFSCKSVR